jgi:hypothetical protein
MNTRRFLRAASFRRGRFLAACLWMIACASGAQVEAHEPSAITGNGYVTFFVLLGASSGSTTIDRQLKTDVETELAEKGFVAVSPQEAEAVVVVNTASAEKHSRDAFYQGWGGWDWRLADTGAANGTENYKVGTVVVDVFDAWTKTLLWHGSTPTVVTSGSNTLAALRERGAHRIFQNLPFGGDHAGFGDGNSPMASDQEMRIIISPVPALLVRIAGEPRFEEVTGTKLQRITNTTPLIVRDTAGMYYLRLGDTWMEAYDVTGSWSPSGTAPEGAEIALKRAPNGLQTDLFASEQSRGITPVVCVSMTPAELIITNGEPEYVPFSGTPLLYVRNTTSKVFREPTDQELYVQVPAGWFRAWTTNGPWELVPEDKLPADLAGSSRLPATRLQIP